MPDLKISLTTAQAAKVIAVLRKREGAVAEGETERTNAELVTATLLNHLSGLVRYDAEQEAKRNIAEF